MLYAKYSRGYRAGGVFANAPADHRSFEPEKVDAYEAGLKTTLRGPLHGTFNVDGFYNNFSNQQLQLSYEANQNYLGTGVPCPGFADHGRSQCGQVAHLRCRSRGHDLAVPAAFVIDLGYTYLNATIRKINSGIFTTTDPLYQIGFTGLGEGRSAGAVAQE